MPYRSPEIIEQLAPQFEAILRAYQAAERDDVRVWLSSLLGHACRELEDFIEPRISVAAQAKASAMELGDLRRFHWDDQVGKMNDRGRKIFHWEHFVPVSLLKRRLMELSDPTVDAILPILSVAEIAWVLKDEDEKLRRLGFGSDRDDPAAAYAAAEIDFEPAKA